jgi:hypothetical protein
VRDYGSGFDIPYANSSLAPSSACTGRKRSRIGG